MVFHRQRPSALARHTSPTSLPRSRRLAGMVTARGSGPFGDPFGLTDGDRLNPDARVVTDDDLYFGEPQQAGHNGRDPDALSHAVPPGQRTIRAPRYGSSLPCDDSATEEFLTSTSDPSTSRSRYSPGTARADTRA